MAIVVQTKQAREFFPGKQLKQLNICELGTIIRWVGSSRICSLAKKLLRSKHSSLFRRSINDKEEAS